jgi:hypothetical protein
MILVYSLGPAGSDEKSGARLLSGLEKTRVAPSGSYLEGNDGSASCKRFDVEDLCGNGLSASKSDVPGAGLGEGQSLIPESLGSLVSTPSVISGLRWSTADLLAKPSRLLNDSANVPSPVPAEGSRLNAFVSPTSGELPSFMRPNIRVKSPV